MLFVVVVDDAYAYCTLNVIVASFFMMLMMIIVMLRIFAKITNSYNVTMSASFPSQDVQEAYQPRYLVAIRNCYADRMDPAQPPHIP